MQTVFFFKNMLSNEESEFRDYLAKKLPKIEKMIVRCGDSDTVLLHVKCEKFEKHSAFNTELSLTIPGENIIATEASHAITKAIDLAIDRLVMQLKKNVLQTRRAHRGIKTAGKIKLLTEVLK